MRIFEIFKSNLGFKIVALILAIVTYIYVRGEIKGKGIGFIEREILKELTSKVISVKVDLKGEPPPGYQLLKGNITVKPERIIIIGKKEDLKIISEISTEPIDIRKFTHTQVVHIPLAAIKNAINVSSKMVEVEIPIIAGR